MAAEDNERIMHLTKLYFYYCGKISTAKDYQFSVAAVNRSAILRTTVQNNRDV
jgi:hypothetical protein